MSAILKEALKAAADSDDEDEDEDDSVGSAKKESTKATAAQIRRTLPLE